MFDGVHRRFGYRGLEPLELIRAKSLVPHRVRDLRERDTLVARNARDRELREQAVVG